MEAEGKEKQAPRRVVHEVLLDQQVGYGCSGQTGSRAQALSRPAPHKACRWPLVPPPSKQPLLNVGIVFPW